MLCVGCRLAVFVLVGFDGCDCLVFAFMTGRLGCCCVCVVIGWFWVGMCATFLVVS